MIRTIAGRHNDSVKLAAKLQKKKHRREKGLFVTEGMDLLLAALEAEDMPVEVLVREDLFARLPPALVEEARADELDIGVCNAETLAHAGGLAGATDVVALFEAPQWSLADIPFGQGVVVYLYSVGDPGNVGTIVRGAVAFGAVGVVLSPGSADAYGPKALRAGMGAHFLLNVVEEVAPEDLTAKLQAEQARGEAPPAVVLADPAAEEGPESLAEVPAEGMLLVLGGERGALPELPFPTRRIGIPQARFDSLNVAMAATVLLYEAARLRLGKVKGVC